MKDILSWFLSPYPPSRNRMRGEVQGECEIVEKMYFNGLLDFVYVELMKGLQKGFVPKRCANCRRWFCRLRVRHIHIAMNRHRGKKGRPAAK